MIPLACIALGLDQLPCTRFLACCQALQMPCLRWEQSGMVSVRVFCIGYGGS